MEDIQQHIQQHVKTCLTKYSDFSGRAALPEFWWFVLALTVMGLALNLVQPFLGTLFSLAVLVPALAVGARRLHDIGKSGWVQLLGLIPVIGWAILIYWAAQPGHADVNLYGAPPEGSPPPASTPSDQ